MNEETVTFFSRGVRLSGTLALPSGGQGRHPCALLLHGYANNRSEFGGFDELAHLLAEAGFASLRFDCRGCGSSGGLKGAMLPGDEWPIDLMSAVSYLHTREEIDPTRLGAVGISLGGSNAIHGGALDSRIRCLVCLCPVADGRRWLEWLWTTNVGRPAWEGFLARISRDREQRALAGRSEWVPIPSHILAQDDVGCENWRKMAELFPEFRSEAPYESAESIINWRPIEYVHRIAPRPVLLIHGDSDPLVPWQESQDLYERAGEVKDIKLVQGADHALLVGPCKSQSQAYILSWLETFLEMR